MRDGPKTKLILSCDTKNEIDDQFAIYYALKSPEIDLLGVISVQNNRKNGPQSVELFHQEAKKIIKLSKSKVPCFKGSRAPILPENPEKSPGVKFLINQILKSKEKITVATTGPSTDLANAMLLEPKIIGKADFIWLGGPGNHEVNFAGDPAAAKILENSEAHLTLVPAWGVADSLVLNCHSLSEKLLNRNSPITDYLAELIDCNWQRFGLIHHLFPKVLKRYWIMFDVAAVATAKGFGVRLTSKSPHKNRRVDQIDAYKVLSQFEKYILG